MSDKGWDDLINLIDEKYGIDSSDRLSEKLEDDGALKKTIERIDFEKDNIKYRIERVTSPAIIDKKTHYHQKGSADRVQYVYDPEETSTKVLFYKQLADSNYNEISPEDMLS